MASLQESINFDRSGYTQVDRPSPRPAYPAQSNSLEPVFNNMLRCPLPPMQVSPDNLRQFYTGGMVPQIRLLTPPSNNVGSTGGGSVINNNIRTTISGGGSTIGLTAKSVTVTSPSLNSGESFQTAVMAAKAFQLLSVAASSPCEIRLYGSAFEQSSDVGRGLDVGAGAGVGQNIITDVALDTFPYNWYWQNRQGANADTPQSNLLYITIINIDETSGIISVTLQYIGVVN